MGVKWLLTYVNNNEILQKVELSLLAGKVFNETGKKPKLLCDFFNLTNLFWVPPVQALITSDDYPEYTKMYGGDFHLFADRVQCFVSALNHIGIEPIFFVDGPRGSDDNFEGKIPILKQRDESRLHSTEMMQRVCEGSLPTYHHFSCHHSIMIRQLLMTLLKTGAKVVFCSGEADPEIIGYAQSHEETCGVLSSDSDFAITSGCVMFPIESFDLKGTLGLNSVLIDDTPGEIVCEVVCPRDVATHLGIRQNQLPDLAALCGNDYTRDILNRLSILTRLGVEGSDIDSVALWLRDKEVVLLDYLPMRDLCIEYPELRIAMEQSYSNYTVGNPLSSRGSEVNYASRLYPVVEQETINGTGMRSFFGVAKYGVHWRSLCCESITLGDPCFSDTLLPVRKSMYVLLGLTEVTEYGRSRQHAFEQMVMPVCASPSEVDVGVKCFHALRELHIEAKLVGLYQIMTGAPYVTCTRDIEEMVENIIGSSHELPNIDLPKLYQVVTLVSCLKMMATLNRTSQPPLNLSDDELDALLVSCLTCSTNGDIPPHMTGVKPSMRTISVGEWFSKVTTSCYRFASLLHLLEAQPEPRNIFYPMVFAPYHIALEVKPDVEEKYKVGLDYIRNAMETALALPAVQAVRSEIFNADQIQPLFQLVDKFFSAQEEIVANQQQLLPQVSTPDLEQPSSDSEDETTAAMFPLDSETAQDKGAMESSTHAEGDTNPSDTQSASAKPCKYDVDIERLKDTVKSLQVRSQEMKIQASEIPLVDEKAEEVIVPSMGLSEKHNILKGRVWNNTKELPIMEHKDKILDQVARFQVVCIEGETGCGKSSQVPQFILHQASVCAPPQEVKVLINQPNFIAAIKLAERVAEERREPLGEFVGYCSEVERYPKNRETALTFCTTGYMLQILQGLQTTSKYSHIILDEIHERSTDIDFTMLVVRRLVLSCPKIKVILMSATLQGGLFIDYFKEKLGSNQVAAPIFVGIKRFPVEELCIDELDELITRKEDKVQDDSMRDLQCQLKKFTEDPSLLPLMRADICPFAQEVCINLIISQSNPGDTILVFLPGSSDISDFYDKFHKRVRRLHIVARFHVFVFHNQAAREDQEDAFEQPVDGTANVILANRSAESSLTFPDLKLVLNFGVSMVPVYSTKEHITKLTRRWCSRASCIQRAGRVGRVSEGTVVHLFPREFYEKLPDFNPPEIVDAPLSKTVLKAKEICCRLGIAVPSLLLSSVVQPPSLLQFEAALHDLVECGALHHNPHDKVSEGAEITLLGQFSTSVPLDLNLCRLVLLGILFRCPLDGIVFATALSMYQDVFTLPTKQVMTDLYQFCSSLARSTLSRMKFDDQCYSNPIMMRNMFIEWLEFKYRNGHQHCSRRELANRFCGKFAVRVGRLLHFETYVSDIARSVLEYIPSDSVLHAELQSLGRIESSTNAEPRICDTAFFSGHDTSKSPQKPTCGKYVPPALRHLPRTQLGRKSSTLHFCSNYIVLKALIAAAASDSSKFLCGERACQSHRPDTRSAAQRSLQMMEANQFPNKHSLAMDLTELDDIDLFEEELDRTDQKAIEKVFRSLPRGYRFPVKVSADEKTSVVHLVPSSYAFSASHSMNEIALKIDPTLSKRRQIEDEATAGSDISVLPLEVEFFWRFGEQREPWEIDDVNSCFPSPFHPCGLEWYELTESRLSVNTVYMNWRNPTAQMCILDNPSNSRFSVVSKVISTRAHNSRYATSITLLPSMPQGLFILLAFQPTASTVELLVDTKVSLVKSLKFNSLQMSCTNLEVYITPSKLSAINALRHAISTAMTIPPKSGHIPLSDTLIQSIPELLRNVLHADCNSPTEMRNPAETSTLSPGRDCVWEMVTPGALPRNAKPGSSLPAQSTDYYPEFRCSILGTEPYSTKEVQSNDNMLSRTYSVEYCPNVADKILAEQSRIQQANLIDERPDSDQQCAVATKGSLQWRVDPTCVGALNSGRKEDAVEATAGLQQKEIPTFVAITGRSLTQLAETGIPSEQDGSHPQEGLLVSTSKRMIGSETGVVEQGGDEEHSLAAAILVKPKTCVPSAETKAGDFVARMLAKHGQSKLEQEVVRHLQRNNKMEFFSELMVQRRIKFLCKVHKLVFDVEFFCCRPETFAVMEVAAEEGDMEVPEQEFLIVLQPSKWDGDEDVREGEEPVLTKSMQLIQAARKSAILRREADTDRSKALGANTGERESDPTQTNPMKVQIDSKMEQGHHVVPTQEISLATTPTAAESKCGSKQPQAPIIGTRPKVTDLQEKATFDTDKELEQTHGEAGQGHSNPDLPNDATITHSSTSITTIQTTEVSGSETVDPYTNAAGHPHDSDPQIHFAESPNGRSKQAQYRTSKEQLCTQEQQGCLDPLCQDGSTTSNAVSGKPWNEAAGSTAIQTAQEFQSVSEVPVVETYSEEIREQTDYTKAVKDPANTPVLQGVPIMDGNPATTESHMPSTSEIRTSEVQPEALRQEVHNQSPKTPASQQGDNGKQRSEASNSATSSPTKQKKKKASTGVSAHAASNSAAKSEKAAKQTAAPERKPSLDPGTGDHLAQYLVDVIRTHGGVIRLSYIRKEVYPQYYGEYGQYDTCPHFFKKVFLMNHPELFQVYKEDSGMVFVKLIGGSSKNLKASEVPVAVTLSAQSSKPEAGQKKSGDSKQLTVKASKPASAIPIPRD